MLNPLDRLQKLVQQAGSQRQVARDLGISPAYLSDVLLGRRQVSAQLALKLGLIRTITYQEAE